MPQTLPFYFFNQITFLVVTLTILVFVISIYVAPAYLHTIVSRVVVTKL